MLTFLRAAKLLPQVRFAAVGRVSELPSSYQKYLSLPNLEVPGFVDDGDLLDYMQRARVYVQASAHEGFGCSLAEAMLCECIPVVTSRGALPEVVGEAGQYVPYGDVAATVKAITDSLNDRDKAREARSRVKREFPLAKRREKLLELVQSLLQ
jgi:glycosyltransferase involved in cell wall biosynthesis